MANATTAASKLSQVLVIDDDQREAENNIELFENAGAKDYIRFIHINPDKFPGLDDYLAFINEINAAAIIIDQRLGEKSGATYTGLELATKIRNTLPKLPLFILTKFSEEDQLEVDGGALDDIMDKRNFVIHVRTYLTRLLRAIGRYTDASSASRNRMNELLEASFSRQLEEVELKELNELRAEVLWLTADNDLATANKVQGEIDETKQLIQELKKQLGAQ